MRKPCKDASFCSGSRPRRFWRAPRPYVDVPNAAALDREREYYGANCERLRQVKARYDPENAFSFEQSVPLSSESTV